MKTGLKVFAAILPTVFLFFSCSSNFEKENLSEGEPWDTVAIKGGIESADRVRAIANNAETKTRGGTSVQETSLKIKSDYQEDSTRIRVIHTTFNSDSVLNLVFVLPVEARRERYQYGNGIDECQQLIERGLVSNNVVFIQPDYIYTPWYGNHSSNPAIRQQNYTMEVINLMKTKYADLDKQLKVFLLGFSKSGWGAMNMLMNHPASIDGILIWDAPLSTGWNEHWGMQEAFGNADHFNENYYFLREEGIPYEALTNKILIIGGYDYFEKLSHDFLIRLDQNGIAYVHDHGLDYPHQWDKHWIQALMAHGNMAAKTE